VENKSDGSAALLVLSIDELFKEARKVVESEDIGKLSDIGTLLTQHFCKKIAQFRIEELSQYNECMVKFLAWFAWGGEPKWEEAVPIIEKWNTILEISQEIFETKSLKKAYGKLKEIPRGEILISSLSEKKIMKTEDIKDILKINTKSEALKVLSSLENAGIIVREGEGKNVWFSLGMLGMIVYREFIRSDKADMIQIIGALRDLSKEELEKAKEKLLIAGEKEPIALCLLGIIALESDQIEEAGMRFTRASELGIDKGKIFLIFYILEIMGRLERLKDGLQKINFQKDETSKEVKSTLRILGWIYEYWKDISRANELKRLA